MTMPTNAQNTKPVRIGFIGAGGICRQRHLPGLNALDDLELVAAVSYTHLTLPTRLMV